MRKGTEGPARSLGSPLQTEGFDAGDAGPRKIGKGPSSHCVYPWGHRKEVYPRTFIQSDILQLYVYAGLPS